MFIQSVAPALLLLMPVAVIAQAPSASTAVQPKAGEDFAFLTGTWTGEAWVQMGDQRYTFQQMERVAAHLDGTILLLEGRGSDSADPGRSLFNAFAVVSWNPKTSGYEIRSYASGQAGTFPAQKMAAQTLRWQFQGPQGTTRYTHRIDGDRWIGVGETSADGKTWTQTLGMNLTRTGSASFEPERAE